MEEKLTPLVLVTPITLDEELDSLTNSIIKCNGPGRINCGTPGEVG